jgi:sigma-E factor negative regulatory protein RseC
MNGEQIHENGIVIEAGEGKAKVKIIMSESCEECSAKILCKPTDENSKVLEVLDPFGVRQGDEVTINIEGSDLVKASLKLYGVPLVLLVVGIILGLTLFNNNELLSFLLGASLTVIYYFLIFILSKTSTKQVLPKIVLIK